MHSESHPKGSVLQYKHRHVHTHIYIHTHTNKHTHTYTHANIHTKGRQFSPRPETDGTKDRERKKES